MKIKRIKTSRQETVSSIIETNGLMQIGIGVENTDEAFNWYSNVLNYNTVIFDDTGEASLMTPHTGNKIFKRRAKLAINPLGGSGIEIWQYLNRKPSAFVGENSLSQHGINAVKLRVKSLIQAYEFFKNNYRDLIIDYVPNKYLLTNDPVGNLLKFEEKTYFINQGKGNFGGIFGICVGVRNLKEISNFFELFGYESQNKTDKKVILNGKIGSTRFGQIYGPSEIELTEVAKDTPNRYDNRFWGDLGFIHLCLDVNSMNETKAILSQNGYEFTLDSKSAFRMGNSSGRFAYVEPEKGLLIELIELKEVNLD